MADDWLGRLEREAAHGSLESHVRLAYGYQRIGAIDKATHTLRGVLHQDVNYTPAREAMAEINPLGWTGMVYGSWPDGNCTAPHRLRVIEPGKDEICLEFSWFDGLLGVFYLSGQLHLVMNNKYYDTSKFSLLGQESFTEYLTVQEEEHIRLTPRHFTGDLVDRDGEPPKGFLSGTRIHAPRGYGLEGFVGPDMILAEALAVNRYYRLTKSGMERCVDPFHAEDQVLNQDQRFPYENIAASELDLRFAFDGSFTEVGIHILDALYKVSQPQEDSSSLKRYHPSDHYHDGTLLHHNTFGEGKVVSAGPRSIDVDFGEHGVKKLAHRKK